MLVGAGPAAAVASTLYVDKANASCTNSGSGTLSAPYCSISAAAADAVAGQTVQVASGTYSEDVTPANSGTSGSPIVFTAAPAANVTVTGGTNGFTLSSRSWIKVAGFTVTGTSSYGILVSSSHDITIQGNHVTSAGHPVSGQVAAGIRLTSTTTSSTVIGNTTDHNSDSGIYVVNSSTGNQILGNVSFSNARGYTRAANGIEVMASSNTVANNIVHDNEDSGMTFRGSSASSNKILDNVSYKNGDHGIDMTTSSGGVTGQVAVGNTVFKNVTAGINVEGGATATIRNNISVDNGIGSPRTKGDYRVDAASVSGGTTLDYDIAYLSASNPMFVWNGSSYTSLAAFRAAVPGQEVHGVQADPKWKDQTAGDFHLTAGSPAIDSADSGAPSEPSTDLEGQARVDDPATANTGAGTRLFDDRGAYEFLAAADSPPNAALSVSAPPGSLTVTADASASTDTDATPISTYTFDFGDSTAAVGPQAGATAPHTYASGGTYTVTVTVKDTANLSSQKSQQVTVGSAPQNLIGNPGFETDTSGWTCAGCSAGTGSLTRVAGGHSGSFAAKVANNPAATSDATLNDSPDWISPTSAGTYTGSLWARADVAGATLKLRFREYANSGGSLVGSAATTIVLSTSWQQVTVVYTAGAPGSSHLDLNALVASAPAGTYFYADDASITKT